MNKQERKTAYHMGLLGDNEPICINCKHFYRHYVLRLDRPWEFAPINVGHCAYPRLKNKHICDTCEHFAQRERQEATEEAKRRFEQELQAKINKEKIKRLANMSFDDAAIVLRLDYRKEANEA